MKVKIFALFLATTFSCYAIEPLDSYVAEAINQSRKSTAINYQSITFEGRRDINLEILLKEIFKVVSFDVGKIREVTRFSVAQVKGYKINNHLVNSALCLTDLGPMIVTYDYDDTKHSDKVIWNIRSPEMIKGAEQGAAANP